MLHDAAAQQLVICGRHRTRSQNAGLLAWLQRLGEEARVSRPGAKDLSLPNCLAEPAGGRPPPHPVSTPSRA